MLSTTLSSYLTLFVDDLSPRDLSSNPLLGEKYDFKLRKARISFETCCSSKPHTTLLYLNILLYLKSQLDFFYHPCQLSSNWRLGCWLPRLGQTNGVRRWCVWVKMWGTRILPSFVVATLQDFLSWCISGFHQNIWCLKSNTQKF